LQNGGFWSFLVIFEEMKDNFKRKLLFWNKNFNFRKMPWKGEKDPYKIWLSEVILQQTRVEQGWAYYEKFIKAFPTVEKLANSPEQIVFKLWEGLGYYSRCKNLIATAKYIARACKGVFPDQYNAILQLKGIGPYTAAAIASFAFNLPYAVVDGNVFRVLSRYFGINTPIDSNTGKNSFTQLANELLHKKKPGLHNQAIMDFGATICKPLQPGCHQCVLSSHCVAFKENRVDILPVKEKKGKKTERWFHYFVVKAGNEVLIGKRIKKDIWENLHEYLLCETKPSFSPDITKYRQLINKQWQIKGRIIAPVSPPFRQQLSHQTIIARFILIEVEKKTTPMVKGYRWVKTVELKKYAFPAMIVNYQRSSQKVPE
jgi:A/G-specific adenine glycosylase